MADAAAPEVPAVPEPEVVDPVTEVPEEPDTLRINYDSLMTDIRYQILSKMDLKTLDQMRLTSKDVNAYVTSVCSGLPVLRQANYLHIEEKGVRWICKRLDDKRPLISNGTVTDVSRRLHGSTIECLKFEIPLNESLVQLLSKSRIRVKNLSLHVASPINLVNQLLSAVCPSAFDYDVSDHSEKLNITDEGDLKDTEIDVGGMELPRCVQTLSLRAFKITGFDFDELPATVRTFITNAPIKEQQANELVRSWQRHGRHINRYVITEAVGDQGDTDFDIERALDKTDAKMLHPDFMLNDRPPTYVVDREQDQSLVIVLGNRKRLVILGPGNPANGLYKDQRNPRR